MATDVMSPKTQRRTQRTRRGSDPAVRELIEKARKELRESLITIAPIFTEKPYFMSDEFTLVDCCVAPILWRLTVMGIELPPKHGRPISDYMDRIFSRDSFQASLSEAELDMRD